MVENPPFDIYPGESKELQITVLNEDDNLNPLDMSNAAIIWELYRDPMHVKVITKDGTTGTDVTLMDAANGIVKVTIAQADTEGLQLGKVYYYYLRVVDNYGKSSIVAKANVNIKN
jgi:hypothetical protein